ncbi:MAG: GAF domain-containing protein [Oscillochloris sp.]|nr:GAF domain-containing protein [Oscillochloris sp.]
MSHFEPTNLGLSVLVEATRLLAEERPLADRLHQLFGVLRLAIRFRDARLTFWPGSARPGALRQQFYSPDGWPYPWDDALTRQVALNGLIEQRTIVVSNELVAEPQLPITQATYLGAPIFWSGRLWGVFELRADYTNGLTSVTQEIIAALTPQLAATIARESAGLPALPGIAGTAETPTGLTLPPQQRHELASLDSRLEQMLDLHALLSLLLRRALEITGAEAGAVCLVDQRSDELVLQIYEGAPSMLDRVQPRQRWGWNQGLAGQAASSGRALLVRDVTQEPRISLTGSGVRAELAAPIVIKGRAAAVILLGSPRSAAFGEHELSFMRALCERAIHPLSRALQYQDALESSNHLGQVFTSLPTGLALLDTNGRVLRSNPAWFDMWGLSGRQRSPFHVSIDLVEQLLPRLQDPLQMTEFCASGQRSPNQPLQLSVRLVNPIQELHILSLPTHDSQEQITGRLWAVSDVTRERESDRLKSEFVSIVSHELRTPLTSILGYTELLLNRQFGDDERRQFINTVYVEAERLSQLVEDLLGVSRLEAGTVKLNRWTISLRQIVNELTTQLNTQLARHRMQIQMNRELPPIYADRDKIKQIIFNLLTNAIKYSPNGGEIVLALKLLSSAELPAGHPEGQWIQVSVSDQGIGIAPEDLPRIWERFYRVDNTNTRRIGGTGLGLSITRALVELHDGRIWAESVFGKGSTFSFTLPVSRENGRLEG